jgi:hypothetical protein
MVGPNTRCLAIVTASAGVVRDNQLSASNCICTFTFILSLLGLNVQMRQTAVMAIQTGRILEPHALD